MGSSDISLLEAGTTLSKKFYFQPLCIKQRLCLWILLVTLGQGDVGRIVEHPVLHAAPVFVMEMIETMEMKAEVLSVVEDHMKVVVQRGTQILKSHPILAKQAAQKEYAWRNPVKYSPGRRQVAGSTSSPQASVSGSRVPGSHTFYKNQCTWFVASQYKIDWGGNAGEWLENAAEAGHTVKDVPEAGDVFVSNESSYGHTGIVESVDQEKGVMIVKDMNYEGPGIVTVREVPLDSSRIKGFIDADTLKADEPETQG